MMLFGSGWVVFLFRRFKTRFFRFGANSVMSSFGKSCLLLEHQRTNSVHDPLRVHDLFCGSKSFLQRGAIKLPSPLKQILFVVGYIREAATSSLTKDLSSASPNELSDRPLTKNVGVWVTPKTSASARS